MSDDRDEAIDAMVDRVDGFQDEWTLPVIARAMLDQLLSPQSTEEGPLAYLASDTRQVAWLGPYGVIPGGMDYDPAPGWVPLYRLPSESTNGVKDE